MVREGRMFIQFSGLNVFLKGNSQQSGKKDVRVKR